MTTAETNTRGRRVGARSPQWHALIEQADPRFTMVSTVLEVEEPWSGWCAR